MQTESDTASDEDDHVYVKLGKTSNKVTNTAEKSNPKVTLNKVPSNKVTLNKVQ